MRRWSLDFYSSFLKLRTYGLRLTLCSPPQLCYPKLSYFCSYAILHRVQKKVKLSYFHRFSPQLRYFLVYSPSYATIYVLEGKIV